MGNIPISQLVRLAFLTICCVSGSFLSGCSGIETFPTSARPGDTVALATGWKHGYQRDNLDVTIVASDNTVHNYVAGDPAIRAVVNLYPDPVSSLSVGSIIGSDGGGSYIDGDSYANTIETYHTGGDPDWWQTVVFVDLPVSIADGIANVTITSPTGSHRPIPVNILDPNTAGIGNPSLFNTDPLGNGGIFPLSQTNLESLERSPHYTITFSGGSVPAAIQIDLQHDIDAIHGGIGRALVVNPGDRKSVNWLDDGQNLRIVLNAAGTHQLIPGVTESTLDRWEALKLYVTGGITGLTINSVQGFDIQGNPINVTANIQ